ncbi:hypothetical protein AB1Y20_013651 [Prymnesium parvum]|uniref:Uncharacterized protein n=1 Tax=Prymnesium parvum TaxID=97485 RepID=A0AB34IGD4_PRYPA
MISREPRWRSSHSATPWTVGSSNDEPPPASSSSSDERLVFKLTQHGIEQLPSAPPPAAKSARPRLRKGSAQRSHATLCAAARGAEVKGGDGEGEGGGKEEREEWEEGEGEDDFSPEREGCALVARVLSRLCAEAAALDVRKGGEAADGTGTRPHLKTLSLTAPLSSQRVERSALPVPHIRMREEAPDPQQRSVGRFQCARRPPRPDSSSARLAARLPAESAPLECGAVSCARCCPAATAARRAPRRLPAATRRSRAAAARLEGKEATATPAEGEAAAAPLEGEEGAATPLEGEEAAAAPLEDKGGAAAPEGKAADTSVRRKATSPVEGKAAASPRERAAATLLEGKAAATLLEGKAAATLLEGKPTAARAPREALPRGGHLLPLQVGGYVFVEQSAASEGLETFSWHGRRAQREWQALLMELVASEPADADDSGADEVRTAAQLKQLIARIQALAQELSSPSPETTDIHGVPLVRNAAGKPPACLAAELAEAAPTAMFRGLANQLAEGVDHPLRHMVSSLHQLQRVIKKSHRLLGRIQSFLPPRPEGAPALAAIDVARSVLELSAKPHHPGQPAAREVAEQLRPLLDEWANGTSAPLLAAFSADLSLHAHTLAINIHRALVAMGDGAVGDSTVLQGVSQASAQQAVAELLHPRRYNFIHSLAVYTAEHLPRLNGGMRWAGLLAQQLLSCLARLCFHGVIADPGRGVVDDGSAYDNPTAQLFQMSVQSGSCTTSEQMPRAAGGTRTQLPVPRVGRAVPLLGNGSRGVTSSLPLMVALVSPNYSAGQNSRSSYSGINGRASLGVFNQRSRQQSPGVVKLHQSNSVPTYLLFGANGH